MRVKILSIAGDLGDGTEAAHIKELGTGQRKALSDTPCLASLPPPESISGAGGFSHPHLPAHRPSWGRGGHRDSQPEPKEGETEGFFAVQEPPHPKYLKPRLVQGGKPRWKSSDPSDTCRKVWLHEPRSRSLVTITGGLQRQARL